MSNVIETDNLSRSYGSRRGIRHVNLSVTQGEVFGFLGPNGAGKTTMIRTLMGFLKPTAGRAEIFGLDSQRDRVEIHRLVGNLPGEFALEDRMTGAQLLELFARMRGLRDLSYAHDLAERLNADLNVPMRRLSRGNKQKIGLIQAMFHRPPLLILDEPTGGLDPLVQEEFLRIVEEVCADGHTVFFSSHILPDVERACDRVGIIREGELITVENTRTLTNRSFRRMTITFARPVDAETFRALPGIRDLHIDGNSISFEIHEGLDDVVKAAATHQVIDIDIQRPTLEEIFLTYYGQQEVA